MKKLLFLLFFIPLMSFSQEIKFDDIMSINSIDTFKRVVIESGYEYIKEDSWLTYGYKVEKTKNEEPTASKWGVYNIEWENFIFQFIKADIFVELEFNKIVSDIKSKCEYFEINGEYVTYNCPDSSFEGQIAFKTSEGSGFVAMFPSNPFQ